MIRRGRSSAADELLQRLRAGELACRMVARGTRRSTRVSRFQTATGKPCSSMLSARLRPIVPRPMTPNVLPLMPISPARRRAPARRRGRASAHPVLHQSATRASRRPAGRSARSPPRPSTAASRQALPERTRSEIASAAAGQPDAGERRRPVALHDANLDLARPASSASRDLQPAGEQPRRERVASPRWSGVRMRGRVARAPAADRRGARAAARQRVRRGPAQVGQRGALEQRVGARPHRRPARRCRARADRRGSARSSSASTDPPRHQTTAGRLDSRSAATALFR